MSKIGSFFRKNDQPFGGISPIKALIWTAILNGIATPPLLIVILLVANNKKIMDGHVNGWLGNTLAGSIVVIMTIATILLFVL
jgi:Mn2+/Fe2+ NRAMP family transporter